jgi:hypothetical protein
VRVAPSWYFLVVGISVGQRMISVQILQRRSIGHAVELLRVPAPAARLKRVRRFLSPFSASSQRSLTRTGILGHPVLFCWLLRSPGMGLDLD